MTATTAMPTPPPAPPARSGVAHRRDRRRERARPSLSLADLRASAPSRSGATPSATTQGYLSTGHPPLHGRRRSALTTEEIDVDADIPGWVGGDDAIYGKVRLRVRARATAARCSPASRARPTSSATSPARPTPRSPTSTPTRSTRSTPTHDGAGRPRRPGRRGHLGRVRRRAPAQQTLDWEAREGRWSVVVMNPDGSRGVDADVSAGVEDRRSSDTLGWGLLGGGALLLLGAAGVGYAGLRRR